ncbi:putative Transposase-associated domain-containing protein [Helianthus debilis subsp. tardiflorus]
MTSDKSWITLRNRRCSEFLNGLDSFMEIASNHVNNEGKAYCPCIRCANSKRLLQELPTIYAHIHDRGFLPSYTTWVNHGEEYANASEIEALWESDTPAPTINNELFDVIADVMAAQNVNEENLEEDKDEENTLDPEFDALFKELTTEFTFRWFYGIPM